MSYYIRQGNTFRIINENDIEVCETLPTRVFTIGQDPMSGEFFLSPIDDFEIPDKMYGNIKQKAKRVIDTFEDRPLTTGVHMDGVKGSGKSLLAKYISHIGKEKGYPTIVINNSYCGEEFNKFVQSINVPAIMLFDEFEKVYDYEHQQKILTLFDGVYPSKKLFLLTTNESHMVSNYLKNRPGRIYYSYKFDTLDPDFVKEYCEDNLKDSSQIESIVRYTKVFSFFNFDMLSSVVEEMNRYGETLHEVLEVLNITPETKTTDTYTVSVKFKDKVFEISNRLDNFNPNNFYYPIYEKVFEEKLSDDEYEEIKMFSDEDNDILFTEKDVHNFDPNTNSFVYKLNKNGKEIEMILTKNQNQYQDFNYYTKLAF